MSPQSHDDAAVAPTDVLDPVCGMTISPDDAAGHIDHKGHTYYFCGESCLEQFRADPARFVNPERKPAAAVAEIPRPRYTCPMHPEIRQKGPGSCPICGMALEPVAVTLEEQPNEELDDMTRRFTRSLVADRADPRVDGCRIPAGPTAASSSAWRGAELDRARPGDPRGAVGRLAVLPARMGIRGEPSSEHVHAHCAGRGRRVRIQCGRDDRARALSGLLPNEWRRGRVLRTRRGHRGARAARAGPGAAGAQPNQQRDTKSARAGTKDRSQNRAGRHRAGRAAGRRACRRPASRPAGRADSCRRRGPRREDHGRRIDGHRRADSRREDGRHAKSPAAP